MSERRDVSFREGGRDGEIMIVHHQIVSSLGNDVSSSSTYSTSLFPPWDGTMSRGALHKIGRFQTYLP